MVMPVQSLMNMEMMLYGGYGMNSNAPSIYNNYRGRMFGDTAASIYGSNYNIYPYQYQNSVYNSPSFGQSIMTQNPQAFGVTPAANSGNTSFEQGITQDDINKLADYYANNNALEEGFKGALTGGLSWMAFENAQSLVHPVSAFFAKDTGAKVATDVFKNLSADFVKKNSLIVQDAYTAVQQATRDTGKKGLGLLRRRIEGADKTIIDNLVTKMRGAVAAGDEKLIAETAQELQAARGFDGRLVSIFSKRRTAAKRIEEKANNIARDKDLMVEANKAISSGVSAGTFGTLIKQSFKKDFVGFMIFETAFSLGKISTAFKKDRKTGIKQTGQSLGKAATGTAGWCLGRAAGTWLGASAGAWAAAKVGMLTGSAVAPGVGTLVGGLIGFTLGSIGMWAGHKLGDAVFGKDVADRVEADNLAKTQEGQVQLLQFAAEKAQEGKLDPSTQQVLNKVLNAYA